jgi:UDP-glucose 4-epimerase
MKTYLVTGGAGFIGSNLCEYLLKKGDTVVCIDDLSAGNWINIKPFFQYGNKFYFKKIDITDIESMNKFFIQWKLNHDNIDTIFHNAASKKLICMTNPMRDLEVNAKATLHLLDLATKHYVKKFVHASTGSVYGEQVRKPQTEKHPLNPLSFYGVSKLAGEKYVQVFHEEFGLNTTILRYYHVFGKNQDWNYNLKKRLGYVIPIFIDRIQKSVPVYIHGDGEQERSFTYVDDVVRINDFVANNPKTNGKIFNCASGLKITVNQLYNDICEIIGNNPKVIHDAPSFGDPKHFDVSHKAIEKLGYKFITDYKRDLERTVRWYLIRRWL